MSAEELGITVRFEGDGVEEKGIVEAVSGDSAPAVKPGDIIVAVDPRYFRPTEVETLLGDPTRARERLGWVPEISTEEMVREMVAYDLDQARQHALLMRHGYEVNVSRES